MTLVAERSSRKDCKKSGRRKPNVKKTRTDSRRRLRKKRLNRPTSPNAKKRKSSPSVLVVASSPCLSNLRTTQLRESCLPRGLSSARLARGLWQVGSPSTAPSAICIWHALKSRTKTVRKLLKSSSQTNPCANLSLRGINLELKQLFLLAKL